MGTNKILHLWFFTCLCLLFVIPSEALGASDFNADQIPPEIKVISPAPDSVIETGDVSVEIECLDIGSDIDETTIQLVLDRVDITIWATIENKDVTGQALLNPRLIRYQPSISLSGGMHQLYFRVRDKAGNLAEKRWRFQVKLSNGGGFQIGGSNTLRYSEWPLRKTADNWELTAQNNLEDTTFRVNVSGHMTDYPEGTPVYRYQDLNFFLDTYALEVNHKDTSLVLGYANAPLDSELMQLGLGIKGGVASGFINRETGRYDWSVFTGKSGSSYGMGIDIYNIYGVSAGWESPAGDELESFYLQLGDRNGYSYTGIKGNTVLGKSTFLRTETIYGASAISSGSGLALHLDQPIAASEIGLDYTLIQPGFPVYGSFLALNSGSQKIGLRSAIAFGSATKLNIEGSLTMDELGGRNPGYRDNMYIGYQSDYGSGLVLTTRYQGNLYYKPNLKEKDHKISVDLQKDFENSKLSSSIAYGLTWRPEAQNSFDEDQLFLSWTKPLGRVNLIPSVQWTLQNKYDGTSTHSFSSRLTVDTLLHPGLSRSQIALFYTSGNDLATVGLSSSVQAIIWKNSVLTFNCGLSHWTGMATQANEGWDKSLSITWKTVF